MRESLKNAQEELKRVDHLIYVSLKYTRTVDVIRSVIERLVAAFDQMMEAAIKLHKDKMPKEIPASPAKRCQLLSDVYNATEHSQRVQEILSFYRLLRKLMRANYKRTNEFRRHVTMIATVDEGTPQERIVNVDIDIVSEYYDQTKAIFDSFVEMIKNSNHD